MKIEVGIKTEVFTIQIYFMNATTYKSFMKVMSLNYGYRPTRLLRCLVYSCMQKVVIFKKHRVYVTN